MRIDRRGVAVAGVLAISAVGGLQAWSAVAAQGDPQLSLRVAASHIEVERVEGDPYLFAELGAYVGVTGSALKIEALPGTDGNADLWQVRQDGGGRIIRERKISTPTRAPMFLGLPDFLTVSIAGPSGVTSTQTLSFCPSGGSFGFGAAARLDASGPAGQQIASTCGSPLTRHIVYGLDRGWAAPVGNELLSNFEGEDGDYRISLSVAPTYVRQFAIPADKAKASLNMTLTTVPCPYDPEFCAPPEGRSATASGSGSTGGHAHSTAGSHQGDATEKLDPLVRAAAADVNPTAARAATVTSSTALRIASARANPERSKQADADSQARAGGLPDLVALPAFDMTSGVDRNGRDQLTFGANIANLGAGPLVVEGFRSNASTMTATQFEYKKGAPVRSFPAGEFEWDPREGHLHWHFEDIARYDLVATDGSITRSGKQAFCLAPTDPIDLTIRGAAQRVETDRLWSACGGQSALWIREVLPAGWGDTYYQGLPGQAFDITELPNGDYSVRVTTNFRNRLKESSTTNNVSDARIRIGGTPGKRTVKELH